MYRYAMIVLAIAMSGCVSTYDQSDVTTSGAKLQRGKAVVIATPERGHSDSTGTPADSRLVVGAARAAFARFTDNITVSDNCSDVACLRSSRAANDNYFVVPEILRWEEQGDETSIKRNRIEIKVAIYEGNATGPLVSTTIYAKSSPAMFGADHPDELVPEAIGRVIANLYPKCRLVGLTCA